MKFTYFTLLTTAQAIELRRAPASSPVALHEPSLAQLGMKIQEAARYDSQAKEILDACDASGDGKLTVDETIDCWSRYSDSDDAEVMKAI